MLRLETPEDLDIEAAIEALRAIPGVDDVHHVHAWAITSGRNVFSGHLRVRDASRNGAWVLTEASDLLAGRFGIYFSTLQIEDRQQQPEAGAAAIDVMRQ